MWYGTYMNVDNKTKQHNINEMKPKENKNGQQIKHSKLRGVIN